MSGRIHIGLFPDEAGLLDALGECRERGIAIVDAHTPYPVHGVDELMGIRRSRLPVVCFLAGVAGLSVGLGFQYWSSAVNWPIDVGGKPFDSLPAFVPVGFELTVLFAGLATAGALLARSRLWPGKNPSPCLEGTTDDRFALVLAERDAALPAGALPTLLRAHGALRVWEEVAE